MTYKLQDLQIAKMNHCVINDKRVPKRPNKKQTIKQWCKAVYGVVFGKLDTLEWPHGQ